MSTVIIAGCGITGPVLALLLQKRGYQPVIIEKVKQFGDVGLGLGLFPNGLKVLSAIGLDPGGVEMQQATENTSAGERLGVVDQSYFKEKYGQAARGVRRTDLSLRLRNEVVRHGIPIHLDWELQEIRETENGVTAVDKHGNELAGSFLVGCDGLHSATRKWVLQHHGQSELPAESTGLVMVGGFSPTAPGFHTGCPETWYGIAKFALTYQIDDTTSIWGVVLPAPDEKETWQHETDLAQETTTLLKGLDGWSELLRTTVATSTKLIKFGLYDRPELPSEQWFYGRCVLLGDAAHPTSPHQGQGANQSLEDCWHLSQLLPDAGNHLTTDQLNNVFQEYAEKRQPRTAMLVKNARAQGNMRVTHGEEACEKRNETVKKMLMDQDAVKARLHEVLKEPF